MIPWDIVEQRKWWVAREHLILLLTEREQSIVRMRYGIPTGSIAQLKAVGAAHHDVTGAQIRQILTAAESKVALVAPHYKPGLLEQLQGKSLRETDWEIKKLRRQASTAPVDDDCLIEELELETRTYNRLKRTGICTIGDICSSSERELNAIDGFGKVCIDDVIAKLAVVDRKLRAD